MQSLWINSLPHLSRSMEAFRYCHLEFFFKWHFHLTVFITCLHSSGLHLNSVTRFFVLVSKLKNFSELFQLWCVCFELSPSLRLAWLLTLYLFNLTSLSTGNKTSVWNSTGQCQRWWRLAPVSESLSYCIILIFWSVPSTVTYLSYCRVEGVGVPKTSFHLLKPHVDRTTKQRKSCGRRKTEGDEEQISSGVTWDPHHRSPPFIWSSTHSCVWVTAPPGEHPQHPG